MMVSSGIGDEDGDENYEDRGECHGPHPTPGTLGGGTAAQGNEGFTLRGGRGGSGSGCVDGCDIYGAHPPPHLPPHV